MTANLTRPRPDIVYLRRRLKVGEQLPVVAQPTTTSSLRLNAPEEEELQIATLPKIPSAPLHGVLDAKHPVMRLNRRQSAVGSLLIAHAAYAAWEFVDGTTGFLYADTASQQRAQVVNRSTGQTKAPLPEIATTTRKNRAVVEFHKEFLVVSLRALKLVKRIIIVPQLNQNLQVGTLGGSDVTLPYSDDAALYLSVVDSCVELRAEKYRGSIHETFRIGTYTPSSHAQTPTGSLHAIFANR